MSDQAPVIDVHVHAVPASIVRAAERGVFEGVTVRMEDDGTRSFEFPAMDPSPPVPAALFDLESMATWASGKGIDVALVGPWTDLLGYTLPPRAAETWSRRYIEALVEECARWPQLEPMGMLPLQAPTVATRMVEEARSLGCRGVVIGTDLPAGDLADPNLEDVWAALSRQRVPVLIHPTFLRVPEAQRRNGLKNAVGRAGATALALARLVYGGVLERHPDLTLIVAHGGGAMVPLIDRMIRSQALGLADSDVDVLASVRRLYWDTVVLDRDYLRYLVLKVGADRLLLGSDHPFSWEPEPVATVTSAVRADEAMAIIGRNAGTLFRLQPA